MHNAYSLSFRRSGSYDTFYYLAVINIPNPTSEFADLSIPRTVAISESISYTLCTQTVTQYVTLYLDGSAVYADPITYTFPTPSAPLTVTYNFPTVTITSLTAGETIVYVFPLRNFGF